MISLWILNFSDTEKITVMSYIQCSPASYRRPEDTISCFLKHDSSILLPME